MFHGIPWGRSTCLGITTVGGTTVAVPEPVGSAPPLSRKTDRTPCMSLRTPGGTSKPACMYALPALLRPDRSPTDARLPTPNPRPAPPRSAARWSWRLRSGTAPLRRGHCTAASCFCTAGTASRCAASPASAGAPPPAELRTPENIQSNRTSAGAPPPHIVLQLVRPSVLGR
jgi:hypothetical protein